MNPWLLVHPNTILVVACCMLHAACCTPDLPICSNHFCIVSITSGPRSSRLDRMSARAVNQRTYGLSLHRSYCRVVMYPKLHISSRWSSCLCFGDGKGPLRYSSRRRTVHINTNVSIITLCAIPGSEPACIHIQRYCRHPLTGSEP